MFTSESGIYSIKNIVNGKLYIGSAVNLRKRINEHRWELKKNIHHSIKLQRSWNKYGIQCFTFSVIELVHDKNNLISLEQFWIDAHDSYNGGYNSTPKAGSNLGYKASPETRAKMSLAKQNMSDETKAKMSESAKNKVFTQQHRDNIAKSSLGRFPTDETKARMSLAQQNMSDETKAKIGASKKGNTYMLGRKHTDETKLKISEAQKNRPPKTEEELKRMSEVQKGKALSEETKIKLSIAGLGRLHSQESKEKMSVSHKNRLPITTARRSVSNATDWAIRLNRPFSYIPL